MTETAPGSLRARGRAALPAAVAVAVAVAGTTLPPLLVLVAGYTLSWRDTARLLGSLRPAVEAELRAFSLPLWQPHEALGLPLLAQLMHGVLHPVSLVAAFVAPGAPMDLQIVLHLALAAAGAWLLARVLGATPWAAAVAGLAYGLSGYVLGMSCVLTYLAGASTAPWAVAGLRLTGAARRGGVLLGGLAVAALVFAGDPQWLIVGLLIGGVLALEAGGWSGGLRAVLVGATGGLLAGVQLLPALAFLPETSRTASVAGWERALWDLSFWRIAELVLPGFFNGVPGSGVAPVFRELGGDVGRHTTSFVPSVFVGALTIVLAALAVRRSRTGLVLAGAAGVALWLALGVNAGADQLLGGVPVWGAFRYSEKLVGPLSLCLAVLAALGTDRVAQPGPLTLRQAQGERIREQGEPDSFIRGFLPIGIALGVFMLAAGAMATWPEAVVSAEAAQALRQRLLVGLGHLALAAALLAAVVITSRNAPRWAAPAAAAAVALQSGAAASFALHAGAQGAIERQPLAALRTEEGPVRITTPVVSTPALPRPDLDPADRLAAFQSRLGAAPYTSATAIDQLDCYSGFASVHFDRFSEAVERDLGVRHWEAWRRLGLTHVSAPRALLPDQLPSVAASVEGGVKVLQEADYGFGVWEVPHRPWASFAQGVFAARDAQEAYVALATQLSLGRPEVVLEGPSPPGMSSGRVLAWERRGGLVRIEAEADGPALLVVNDAFWPGWQSTLDGVPVEVQRADVLVRAVPFPAGRHVLEMRYAPPELTWGLAASAAGVAALAVLLLLERRRRAIGQ
ncbi:hypothetical protein [Anaeromyxobacter sp. Fw109-5]|uniref:hypothetical protein n=1 Tax=Anaeromyxobacter sp. (strain Fw109-5) TaxID=404589 RepID=UPI0000ED8232|nr:hypothetical protein [Anaeromyxobacter sp. Fw109-5]ABS26031.1 hypothetical protein Anae109_1828 [Anaeromyxobacter sp. Fw109-5]